MNNLIEIKVNENEEQVVSARELYNQLGLDKSNWKRWYEKNIVNDDFFKEGIDYINIRHNDEKQNLEKGRPSEDFAIKIDMAKELCMLARTEQGKKMRMYFIQVEKEWNSPEKVMQRALIIANKEINVLKLENKMQEQVINELKPKADYTDTILKSSALVTITQIAKDYGMSGQALNKILNDNKIQYKQSSQWLLYSNYQSKGFTHSETIHFKRSDGRTDVKMETKWTQKGRLFLYDFLKGIGIVPVIEREA